jgi:hypothetical protein
MLQKRVDQMGDLENIGIVFVNGAIRNGEKPRENASTPKRARAAALVFHRVLHIRPQCILFP